MYMALKMTALKKKKKKKTENKNIYWMWMAEARQWNAKKNLSPCWTHPTARQEVQNELVDPVVLWLRRWENEWFLLQDQQRFSNPKNQRNRDFFYHF